MSAGADTSVERKLTVLDGQIAGPAETKVLSPKAVDELREILRSDEDIREFFLLLKDRELRKTAIAKLNAHLSR